jgi:hypothetical protein
MQGKDTAGNLGHCRRFGREKKRGRTNQFHRATDDARCPQNRWLRQLP